jgi:hypothetical protein
LYSPTALREAPFVAQGDDGDLAPVGQRREGFFDFGVSLDGVAPRAVALQVAFEMKAKA